MRAKITEKAKIMVAIEDWVAGKPNRFGPQVVERDAEFFPNGLRTQEKPQAMMMIEHISIHKEVTVDHLLEGFKNANQGRLHWDGSKLTYMELERASVEFRQAAILVMAYAIRLSLKQTVLFDEESLYDWAKTYFDVPIASRYFAAGEQALTDVRHPIWKGTISEIYGQMGRQ
jgi:hypothetical protein